MALEILIRSSPKKPGDNSEFNRLGMMVEIRPHVLDAFFEESCLEVLKASLSLDAHAAVGGEPPVVLGRYISFVCYLRIVGPSYLPTYLIKTLSQPRPRS